MKKFLIKLLCYVFVVACIFLCLYQSGLTIKDLTPETILKLAHNNMILVLAIMLILMCLQNLFTFIPLILVITLNIALLGFWQGYFYGVFCSVVGSTLIFSSIRYVFHNSFSSPAFKKYDKKIEKNGFLFVFSGRVLPFMPTNLINIVSGFSTIKMSHFIAATTLGNLIYGFVLATASFGLQKIYDENKMLFYIIIVIVVGVVLYRYSKKFRKKSHNNVTD